MHLGDVPADKRDITLHQLLTHTSGLVDSLGDDDERVTRAQLVGAAMSSELQSAPGTEYGYSNVGYSLLAAVVEQASGTGYEEYVHEHLFTPAGMLRTGYALPDWPREDVAVEYDAAGRPHGRPFEHPWADDGPYWNLRGNGGMLSTARDVLRWHRALQGDAVLDDDARRQLFEPRVREEPGGDTSYAYGWVVRDGDDDPVLWHNGANDRAYGEIARTAGDDNLVFWVVNQAKRARRLGLRGDRPGPDGRRPRAAALLTVARGPAVTPASAPPTPAGR